MIFTDDKTNEITDRLDDMKREEPWTDGNKIGVGVTLGNSIAYGAAAYKDNMFICTVAELDRTIEELQMLKKAIIEKTGVVF